jgi:aryl-alcohol dehydrogenase-like predicted oxidoreductase
MRLSIDKDRDDARALEVLTAALAAGIDLLDTADCYAHDDRDIGHNERLIAQAIAAYGRRPYVVTKGGLMRPGGAWVPNGRARHLDAAARASRDRLGEIDLYLLHAVDPKAPLATSVRALAKLRDQGIVRAIGLGNVGLHQLEQALAITSIDAIEVELSPWHLDAIRGGLLVACKQRGIRVLAHRPLGGPAGVKRIARDEVLAQIAARYDARPHEIVLAWLRRLGVVPLPGATRIETARSAARIIELDAATGDRLDQHFVTIAEQPPRTEQSSEPSAKSGRTTSLPRAAHVEPNANREVVIIVGMPAAGKTTLALDYAARGYLRLNRDERGGSLVELARVLDRELAAGATHIVLDNTYGTRASRAPVVEVAKRHDVPVRCLVATTSLEQAQANAVARMLELHGRLLEPAEMRKAAMIAPNAQFRYRREYEPPRADEGFAAIEDVGFAARDRAGTTNANIGELSSVSVSEISSSPSGATSVSSSPISSPSSPISSPSSPISSPSSPISSPASSPTATAIKRPAVVVELDDLVWRSRPRSADDIQLLPGIRDHLARWHDAGYVLAGTTWLTLPVLDARLGELL